MATRTEQREATRQRVLAAATRLVEQRGFTATRTADVARATRLSHGAVFVHFPSRKERDLAVAAAIGRAITDRLHALARDGQSFRDVLRAHVRCIEEHEAIYARLLVEGPLLPKEVGRTWTAIQSAVAHHLGRVAGPAMQAGAIRAMPLHLLFNTWIGLLHHYLVNRALFAPDGSVLATHGETLVAHYLALVTTKKGAR